MTDEPIQEEILSPEDQVAELTAKWKRTAADFENFKKRKEAESKELFEFAKEMAVLRLMPSLQSLEQVLFYAPDDEKYKDWLTGLKATILQLEKSMEELGVVKIKTVGEQFDPTRHEAVEEVEGQEAGKVIKELQPGFTLNNKVIIPAKVTVGK
jgi:molecular chaperone GrpE